MKHCSLAAFDSAVAAAEVVALAFVAAVVTIHVAVAKPIFGHARVSGSAQTLVGPTRAIATAVYGEEGKLEKVSNG